jgi:hypothetical protein
MGNTTTSLNRRLSNTSKVLDRWKGTTDKAADGLKNVRDQMDAVIDRQSRLNGRILGGGGVGGGNGGGSGAQSGSGGSGSGGGLRTVCLVACEATFSCWAKLATLLEPLKKFCSDGKSR